MVPWSTPVLNPNGISIGLTIFAGLTRVTDRQIPIERIYVGLYIGYGRCCLKMIVDVITVILFLSLLTVMLCSK